MTKLSRFSLFGIFTAALAGSPGIAMAHEAYVVPTDYFWSELMKPFDWSAWSSLTNPENLRITITVIVGVFVVYFLNFLFRRSKLGEIFGKGIERFAPIGPHIVRAAIAAALFFSALNWSFLGPELSLQEMPVPQVMRAALFIISGCFALGLFTEVAAFVGLVIFTMGLFVYGTYIFSYLNYLGELIVLFLFGMRQYSLDRVFFGPLKRYVKWEKYESSIVRICYGFALTYAAVSVKMLHPELTEHVFTSWNLAQFWWLFPSDPALVTLGAGLAELAIGIFIIFGFELRLTVLITLFYITLSLIYFQELVWPHLLLYGISLNLILQPEIFTLDHFFFYNREERLLKRLLKKKKLPLWKRPLQSHSDKKSSQ